MIIQNLEIITQEAILKTSMLDPAWAVYIISSVIKLDVPQRFSHKSPLCDQLLFKPK